MPQVIIRPNANGSIIQLGRYPSNYQNWQCVADVTPDEDSTYVAGGNWGWATDTYELGDTNPLGTINYIQVWIRCRTTQLEYGYAKTVARTYNTNYLGSQVYLSTTWADYSTTYYDNPYTNQPWTWTEINSLQTGVSLYTGADKIYASCTQVYVVVDYIPSGAMSRGFIIG